MNDIILVSRRTFLALGLGAAGSLVLGCRLGAGDADGTSTTVFEPNAYLALGSDGTVTVWVPEAEMGQGVLTALAVLVADEAEADWKRVRVEQAPVDPERFGKMSTGGSTSVREGWKPLRLAGATVREMLLTAAASRLGVERATLRAREGRILHPASGRSIPYGELVEAAAGLPLPEHVPLKKPSEFRLIGTPVPRVDTPAKVTGAAAFAIDVRRDTMLYAVIARCPVFGGTVRRFDDAAALKLPGVRKVLRVPTGVAVLADSTWAAIRGREALEIQWDEGEGASWDDRRIHRYLEERASAEGVVARSEGSPPTGPGTRRLEHRYSVPFLAHAPMEPLNAVADVRPGRCEMWVGSQSPTRLQSQAAKLLGIDVRQVTVHQMFLGGGFGRRAWPDFGLEAVEVSRAAGVPVKLTWTREDDMRHDFYRPVSLHVMAATVDPSSRRVLAWHHKLVAPSILEQLWPGSVHGVDEMAVSGAKDLPYAIPAIRVEYVMANTPVPIMWWRSVYASQNAFANEAFLDEIARAIGKDPVKLRLELLENAPRLRKVVEVAAEGIGWGRSLPPGHGLGIACHASFGSFVAHAAEVAVERGRVRVLRVVAAVDCGPVVNPDTIAAQMDSAVVYGLSAALRGRIRIRGGAVVEGNWDDYEPLRLDETPAVETRIVPSEQSIGGIGEPGLPPIAPAVVNAIFAATGTRVRSLPIAGQHGLEA
ncbi:MAG TPA: xanthine dehydrogenase family protein molybdopterin-binding subunit [Acidobacteria bacterium]|nr:xanthine dehydrogenase family protein molybdopterin-binding subunit [Acidobacteriota bacterium]